MTGKAAERRERTVAAWRRSEWEEVRLFLGSNAERFRPAWEGTREKMLAGRPAIAWSWCWPALVFGFAWFLYRKQWALAAVLLLLPLAIGYFIDTPGGATVGIGIAIAAMAKSIVVQAAVTKIDRIRAADGDEAAIARAGGVSVVGGIVGGVLIALFLAAAILFIYYLVQRGGPG